MALSFSSLDGEAKIEPSFLTAIIFKPKLYFNHGNNDDTGQR